MTNAIKHSAYGTYTTAIAGASSAPTLKNCASSAMVLGNEIDNTSGRDTLADWDLYIRFQVAPATGAIVCVWFIQAVDGTNYADGSASVEPARGPDMVFPVRAVTTQQRVDGQREVVLPAGKFKPLFKNSAGQAMTNTDNENVLSYRPYNREIQ